MGHCVLCKKKVKRGAGAFFQAPPDDERRALWRHVCQREFKKRDLICVDHFLPSDYILGQKRATLLPKAVPIPPPSSSSFIPNSKEFIGDEQQSMNTNPLRMPNRMCIMGCPPMGHPKYPFPWDRDRSRRKMWFQQFTLDPAVYTQKYLYACRRHFSSYMTMGRNLRPTAYPDVNLHPFNPAHSYVEKYSYYENAFTPPDERYHDNVGKKEEKFIQTSLTEIQYAPVTHHFPKNTHTDYIDINKKDSEVLTEIDSYHQPTCERKRQCILKCLGSQSFHRIPSAETDLELRKKWLYLLSKDPDLYTKNNLYVCDLHFDEHMMCLKRLVRGGYPNKNLPPPLRGPVPEAWEEETECILKCTDYERKYPFPSHGKENLRRQTWLKQFNCDPELYTDAYIYACDRHFDVRKRVGPYLHPETIPELNLPPSSSNNPKGVQANYISKKWSLQRLEALTKDTIEAPNQTATDYTNFHTTQHAPQQQSLLRSSKQPIQLSLLGPSQNASQQPIQFSVIPTPQNTTIQESIKLSLLCPPQHATQPVQLSLQNQSPNTTQESLKVTTFRPKEDEILKRLNMIKMQHMNANSSRVEEYVKIQTLGVFVPHRDGHFVAMDKVLSAIDPLDIKEYAPLDWVEPIEPELSIKAHHLPKELYENTDAESEVETSPKYLEYSDEDTNEIVQICGKRKNKNLLNYVNTKCIKIVNTQDRIEDVEVQYKVDDPTVVDQLTAVFPKDNKKCTIRKQPITINKHISIINSNNIPQGAIKVTDNTESIITPNDKAQVVTKVSEHSKNIITPNDKPQVAAEMLENPVKTVAANNRAESSVEIDFEDIIVSQQIQKSDDYMRAKDSVLRKAVVSAESWQQVMSAIKEASPNTAFTKSTERESDQIAEKVRKMVEQIKQACERDKQSITDAKICDKVSVPPKSGPKILKIVPNGVTVLNKSVVGTADTIEDTKNPSRVVIKSVDVIKSANIARKVSNVTDKCANVGCVTNLKANAMPITKLPMRNAKIASVTVPTKSLVITSNRPTAIKAYTLPPTVNSNHHHNTNEEEHNEFEGTSIEDLLAKAKHLINECDVKAANNAELLLDNTILRGDDEMSDMPDNEANEAISLPPSCILKCVDFEKLHAFPSADTSTYRRHFWFMELGLDISIDWLKTLHICDKHFDKNMFLADKTLKEFAYPYKELNPQLNSFRVERATQTQSVGGQYKQKLLDEFVKLRDLNNRQNIELDRIKILIRLKQEAARLMAEIKTAKETITE